MRRALVVLVGALGACSDGASPALGLDALLQIPGAQYLPGPFPADTGGPATRALQLTHAVVPLGEEREKIVGVLDPDARTGVVGLVGVDGAWLVNAGYPDLDAPGTASLHATIGLTDGVEPGPFELQLAAGGADGRIGPARTAMAIAADAAPISGLLVLGLTWSGRADLDLHVVTPDGVDVYVNNPNSHPLPPPGTTEPPDAWKDGGILDHDGNASCTRDAAPAEHVIWTRTPPSGTYTLRVEARALCGDAIAAWYVDAFANATADDPGTLLGAARGLSVPDDVSYGTHGKGGGVTALTFTLP